MSLRAAVNDHCKSCTYDNLAPGTWKQQVTLCSANECALYEVRPKTTYAIPESVLSYYGVKSASFQPQNESSMENKGE